MLNSQITPAHPHPIPLMLANPHVAYTARRVATYKQKRKLTTFRLYHKRTYHIHTFLAYMHYLGKNKNLKDYTQHTKHSPEPKSLNKHIICNMSNMCHRLNPKP